MGFFAFTTSFFPGPNFFTLALPATSPVPVPDGTFWVGMTFDNNNGITGATAEQLNNLGVALSDPPTLGSSLDWYFQTSSAGPFNTSNPGGFLTNLGGTPPANFFLAIAVNRLSPNLAINWSSMDGGGGTSSNGTLTVRGTIGQPDAGNLSGGTLAIKGGFWGVITAVQTPGAPLLTITRTEMNTVIVSWPSPSTGFNLQQNNDLNTSNWVPSEGVTDNGTTKSILVNLPVGNRFYRLLKP